MSEDGTGEVRPSPEHAISALDIKVTEVEGAEWAATMEVNERVTNSGGALQGGLLATLIDIVAGSSLLVGPEAYDQTSTMDLHITYHAGARVGPVLATAHVLRRGGSSTSVRVEVVDVGAGNVPVATALLTFAARHLPPGDARTNVSKKAKAQQDAAAHEAD